MADRLGMNLSNCRTNFKTKGPCYRNQLKETKETENNFERKKHPISEIKIIIKKKKFMKGFKKKNQKAPITKTVEKKNL